MPELDHEPRPATSGSGCNLDGAVLGPDPVAPPPADGPDVMQGVEEAEGAGVGNGISAPLAEALSS
jgi:hypothetical protein